ncbi:MAG: tetratricopeptide repeat protein [Planctomycetes bacterium]|nr:tetratricopeptide repeat protein [Planctomycetota bacterium]
MSQKITLNILLFFFGLAGFLPAADETEEQFQKAMLEGAQCARTGPLPRALARFKTAIDLKPRSAEAHYRLALTYNDRMMYDSAEKEAQKAITLDEDHAGAWLVLGSALFYQDMEEAAIEALNKAFRLEPENAHIPYMLARCYYFLGAREKLKAAELNQNASNLSADESRQVAIRTRNLEEKAQTFLRKSRTFIVQALKLDRNYVEARFMEGCIFLELDLPDAARYSFMLALLADPNNPEIHFRIGICYQLSSKPIEAERSFQEVLRLDHDHVEAHLRLGDYFTKYVPNEKMAAYHYGRFLQLAPEDHSARKRLAREEQDDS